MKTGNVVVNSLCHFDWPWGSPGEILLGVVSVLNEINVELMDSVK